MHRNYVKNTKIIVENQNYMLDNTIASNTFTFGTKLGFFLSPFLVNTGWFLILEKLFRTSYVAACSTALREATEDNDSGGHIDVPCSSILTQHKSTAGWLKVL